RDRRRASSHRAQTSRGPWRAGRGSTKPPVSPRKAGARGAVPRWPPSGAAPPDWSESTCLAPISSALGRQSFREALLQRLPQRRVAAELVGLTAVRLALEGSAGRQQNGGSGGGVPGAQRVGEVGVIGAVRDQAQLDGGGAAATHVADEGGQAPDELSPGGLRRA